MTLRTEPSNPLCDVHDGDPDDWATFLDRSAEGLGRSIRRGLSARFEFVRTFEGSVREFHERPTGMISA